MRELGGSGIFATFLRLGCTSFGGPIAHLGYFREEFVERKKWLDDATFTDIVGLCQFLPGPASSQVGFVVGLLRGGFSGALAAWAGFTLPSAVLMYLVATGRSLFWGRAGMAVTHALELVAVAVIAQAVWGMMRTLAPDRTRAMIAILAAACVLLVGSSRWQLLAIPLGGVLGYLFCRGTARANSLEIKVPVTRSAGIVCLLLFMALLMGPAVYLALSSNHTIAMFQAFYRSGALVFGGGHVVLPLLQAAVVRPGWTDEPTFLAGYGATQAMPGPLFTFAAYLGAVVTPSPNGMSGAALALVAIFLPGLLLVTGVLPFWNALRGNVAGQAVFAGVNASVVGILFAVLCTPIWARTILKPSDFVWALAAFLALVIWRMPAWVVVVGSAILGAGFALMRW
jgi:chromate transporter